MNKFRVWVSPLSIFLLSLIFRITNLNLIEFKGDEATNLYLAAQPIFGHPMPYGGTVSSVGVLNPPIFNYMLFPFTLISLDPKVISFMIGLLNSVAIVFLFLLIKKFYDEKLAFIATILLALSPWAIIYSRKIWPQDFILFLVIPLLYSVYKIKENNNKYWIIYTSFSLFLIQLHQSGLFFVPLLTLFLILSKVKIDLRFIIIGAIIGLIPLIPYLSYEISNHCPDCKAYQEAKKSLNGKFPVVFARPLQILSQGDFQSLLYNDMAKFAKDFPLAYKLRQIFYLEYLLLPLGLILFWKNIKKERLFVYLCVFLPIVYFLSSIVPHMHYFIVILPLLFLFLSYTIYIFITNKNIALKYLGKIILISLTTTSVIFDFSFFSLVGEKKNISGDYGTIFSVNEKIAKDRLKGYEKDPRYNLMLLASYVPKDSVYGNLPLGKMLYSRDKIKNKILYLDKRLQDVPVDEEAKRELISFYTESKLSRETIELLRDKTKIIPAYNDILLEIEKVYDLSKNNK